jgi:serine-type D-Ala-D-Ala carboxypeptidase (penicillin-binding protein 5/6)
MTDVNRPPSSPLLTPHRSRRRVYRRRRRTRYVALAGIPLVVAVGVAALAMSGVGAKLAPAGHAAHKGGLYMAGSSAATSPHIQFSGAHSTLGLPLAYPALTLTGLNDPAQDPVQAAFTPEPRAGLLFNLETGRVLWQLHPTLRAPIASLTKMMTALLVVQSTSPSARVLITQEAENAPGSRVGVLPLGRQIPVETMMYGLLLPSGNDAAVALAEHVAGTVTHFVQEMNEEAAVLGLGCTQYSTPSGYVDQNNFSCPADLAVLAHDDLLQPRIARIVRSPSAVLPFPIKGGRLFLYNNNPILIYGYPGADGLKTGYTMAAGPCLVATAERDGVRLGVVLMDSPEPGTQAQRLLDEGFEDVYHVPSMREPAIPGGV